MFGKADDHRKTTWISIPLAERDSSAMGADHMVHDGQTKAAMALLAPCRIKALKGLKGTFPFAFGYPGALIPNFNRDFFPRSV